MPLTIERQKTTGMIEFGMVMHCRKEIQNLPVVRCGVANSIGRQKRELEGTGNPNRRLIPPLLLTLTMSLQFDVDAARTEDTNQPFHVLAACLFSSPHH